MLVAPSCTCIAVSSGYIVQDENGRVGVMLDSPAHVGNDTLLIIPIEEFPTVTVTLYPERPVGAESSVRFMMAVLPIAFANPFSILMTLADEPVTSNASNTSINAENEIRVIGIGFMFHTTGWLYNVMISTYPILSLPWKSNAETASFILIHST